MKANFSSDRNVVIGKSLERVRWELWGAIALLIGSVIGLSLWLQAELHLVGCVAVGFLLGAGGHLARRVVGYERPADGAASAGARRGRAAGNSAVPTRLCTEQQLRLAVDGAGLGLWDWELDSGYTVFNDEWFRMLGYRPMDLPMNLSTWESLTHPEDLQRAYSEIRRHLAGDVPRYRCELRMRCKNGEWKSILDVGEVSERDENGKPTRMTGVHIDIDEVRHAESERRRAQELLQIAVDTMPQRVFWKDREGRYLGCNIAFAKDAGVASPHAMLGTTDYDSKWREQADKYRGDDLAVMAAGAARLNYEEPLTNEKGELLWVRTSKVPLRDESGQVVGVMGTFQDVTAERSHNEELMRAKEAAEAASRAKSEFLANMSHEIRTPLTAILGFADLLADPSEGDEARRRLEYVSTIQRNGQHLLAVINDILDLSKIEAGKMALEAAQISLPCLISETVELIRARADGKGLALRCEFATAMPSGVTTDPTRLRQVLNNLVGNAIKFTEIGSVTVRVACAPGEDARSASLRIDVVDTGIGIEADRLSRLFAAFEQADTSMARRFGGTGLGLHISHRLAHALGGSLSVSSEFGKGSTFSLALGVATEPGVLWIDAQHCGTCPRKRIAGDSVVAKNPRSAQPLAGCRILLAEDGPDNQRLITYHLRRAGATVKVVQNGKLAVEALTSDGTVEGELQSPLQFDIVLSDMQMPEMDGYAAARLLRSKGYGGPIIAMTAHALDGERERCLMAGCSDYCTKPIQRGALIDVCLAALGRRVSTTLPVVANPATVAS